MQRLETEMSQRFPELAPEIAKHQDLPYLIMSDLARWLERVDESAIPAALERVRSFVTWCKQQPRGQQAGADLLTILVVGFFEKLFESDAIRRFVPVFLTRDDLERDPAYWKTWVGEENYAKAMEQFTATT
jgi:hypothetical protein